MQGNGQFFSGSLAHNNPIKLELQTDNRGFVNVIASLPNGVRLCIGCFRNGGWEPAVLNNDIAAKFHIKLDSHGFILQK